MEKQQIAEMISGLEAIYVPFSQMTRMPFLICDEETFNDQVWIFETEEAIQEFAKKYTEEKILLAAGKIPQKRYKGFFTSLHSLGVNEIVYQKEGERLEIDLDDLAAPPDFSQYKEGQEPLMNPSLQLSGIYFMQELRRAVPEEEKRNLAALQEELNANLVRSSYLMALEPVDEKNVRVPYIKSDKGEIYQPIFTDAYEYQKFAKDKKFRILKVKFDQLNKHLLENSAGYIVNPKGFNLILQKKQMEKK